ncbi:tigger transposable element-derived protein 4-like [Haliotis cracherodii]|uniref:tigger transposable element-derived protein 4-like n=1 Tax=Haliotis cracherodii TaxID=6455 RepID=UPI0039EAC1DC
MSEGQGQGTTQATPTSSTTTVANPPSSASFSSVSHVPTPSSESYPSVSHVPTPSSESYPSVSHVPTPSSESYPSVSHVPTPSSESYPSVSHVPTPSSDSYPSAINVPTSSSDSYPSASHVPTPSSENYMVFNIHEATVTMPQTSDFHMVSALNLKTQDNDPPQPADYTFGNLQYSIKPTKARNDLSLANKVRLIRESESTGKSQRQLAAEFSISLGSVNNILRRKREYVEAYENSDCPTPPAKLPRRIFPKKPDFDVLNALVVKWAEIAQTKNIPISRALVQEKAKEFAKKLNMYSFSPSQVWLENIQKLLHLPLHSSAENSDLTAKLYTVWMKMLPYLVQGYEPENVFTCGETALFYKGLPDKCYVEGGVCLGTHHNVSFEEHRFTLLFCCSATGEKLQPLVIGTNSYPFSCQSLNSLPVTWRSQPKACMTSSIFAEWLQRLDLAMENQGRRIALFMDMAPAHLSSLVLKNVSLKFYMDNSSSYLQPLQQGIITAFKSHYRKRFLQAILARVEASEEAASALKNITELDAIYWIRSAWDNVKTSLICNCFDAVGFSTSEALSDDGTNSLLSNLPELVEETGQALKFTPMYAEVYLQFDSQVLCHVYEEAEWEKQLIAEALGRPMIKTEPEDTYGELFKQKLSDSASMHSQLDSNVVLQNEALDCLSKLKSFAVNDTHLLTKLYSLEETMLESISAKRRRAKYRSINILHMQ